VDVYNGNNLATGLAGKFSAALVALGYKAGAVDNASDQSQPVTTTTQVFYGAGASANANKIATEIGTKAAALASLPAGHVEVLTGSTVTEVPAGLSSPGTPAAGSSGGATSAPKAGATHPVAPASSPPAGVIKVKPNSPFGVPCVY
jgi:hypothetical protein